MADRNRRRQEAPQRRFIQRRRIVFAIHLQNRHDWHRRRLINDPLPSLPRGEAMIMKTGTQQVAAYRAPDGTLSTVSPVCPHMKCKVRWNSVETSWDCPCHGSRFQPDGQVIEGPAIEGLAKVEISQPAEARAESSIRP